MAVLSGLNTFNNGDVIDAPQMNTNFTQVKNFVDGLSAGTNFDAGAIGTATIANSSITEAKIATAAVTTTKIAASVTLTTPNIGAATGTSLSLSGNLTVSGSAAITGNIVGHILINEETASYSLLLVDDGALVEMNVSSSNNLTVEPDSTTNFPIGSQIVVLQTGTGQTTLVQGTGVTINATPGLKLRARWSSATLIKRAANTWVAIGDLSS